MTRACRVAALLAALMLVGAAPAAAANAMTASLELSIVGFTIDPDAVAARCPPVFPEAPAEWPHAILQSAGTGTMTSEAYTGPITISESHCSMVLAVSEHQVAVVLIRAGRLTAVTPGGDTLTVAYRAPGVFKGDLTLVGARLHVANGPYTVTGGTGVLAGASGHGHIHVFDDGGPTGSLTLNGSLAVAD